MAAVARPKRIGRQEKAAEIAAGMANTTSTRSKSDAVVAPVRGTWLSLPRRPLSDISPTTTSSPASIAPGSQRSASRDRAPPPRASAGLNNAAPMIASGYSKKSLKTSGATSRTRSGARRSGGPRRALRGTAGRRGKRRRSGGWRGARVCRRLPTGPFPAGAARRTETDD